VYYGYDMLIECYCLVWGLYAINVIVLCWCVMLSYDLWKNIWNSCWFV